MVEILFYQLDGEKKQHQVNRTMSSKRVEIYRNELKLKHGKNILFGIKYLAL